MRILAATLLLGCGLDPEGGLLSAEAKLIVNDHEDSAEVLGVGVTIAAAPALVLTPATVTLADAVAAQTNLEISAQPPGCLAVETEGNRVTYTIDRCTGPWGRVEVSGVAVATFSPGSETGAFVVDASSDGLTINGVSAAYAATAEIRVASGARTVDWQGAFSGSTADGRPVDHEADVRLVLFDDGAASLEGQSSTKVGIRSLEVDIPELMRRGPPGTCAEGTVILERKLGSLTVTLTFDGTNEYVAKTSRGGRGTFELPCTPAGAE